MGSEDEGTSDAEETEGVEGEAGTEATVGAQAVRRAPRRQRQTGRRAGTRVAFMMDGWMALGRQGPGLQGMG